MKSIGGPMADHIVENEFAGTGHIPTELEAAAAGAAIAAYQAQALKYNKWIENLQDLVAELRGEVASLEYQLREVWEESAVSFDDERLGYVEIQMTRSTWESLADAFRKEHNDAR